MPKPRRRRLKPLAIRPYRLVTLRRLPRATHLVPKAGADSDVLCGYEPRGGRQGYRPLTVTRGDLDENFASILRGLCGECRVRAERGVPVLEPADIEVSS